MGLDSRPRESIRLVKAVDKDRLSVGWSRQGLCFFKGAGSLYCSDHEQSC
jgi:hypothetical protein